MEFLGKIIGRFIGALLGLMMLAFFMLVSLCFYAAIGAFAGFILQWLAGDWIINLFATCGVTIASVWPIGLIIGVVASLLHLSKMNINVKTSH